MNTYFSDTTKELDKLKKEMESLKMEYSKLARELEETKNTVKWYDTALSTVFSKGQIRKLFAINEGNRNITLRWSSEDIASTISLRSVSPKAYRYLRARNYPLPALSTLRRWASKFDISQGILKSVLTLMKKKSRELNETERLCILSFNEVYLSNKVDIDKRNEQKIGPRKFCHTVFARGLVHWKQPVYYQFDQPMTTDILIEIISNLHDAGFTVVGIVSDMDTTNTSMWPKLDVAFDKKCFFSHPNDSAQKIFVFADARRLLKLARNYLLDHGFTINNQIINVDYVQSLLVGENG